MNMKPRRPERVFEAIAEMLDFKTVPLKVEDKLEMTSAIAAEAEDGSAKVLVSFFQAPAGTIKIMPGKVHASVQVRVINCDSDFAAKTGIAGIENDGSIVLRHKMAGSAVYVLDLK